MRILPAVLCASTVLLSATNARITEQQKENFYEYITGMEEGRSFLSHFANKIMDKADAFLKFNAWSKYGDMSDGQVGDWLGCQTCRASAMALDASVRTQMVT